MRGHDKSGFVSAPSSTSQPLDGRAWTNNQQSERYVGHPPPIFTSDVTPVMIETGEHHRQKTPSGSVIDCTRAQRHGPMVVPESFLKWMMRASTGNAVMHIDAPKKSIATKEMS